MRFLEILRARLAELATEREAAIAEMEAVTAAATAEERSALTEDESAAFDEARGRVDTLDAEISATEERIGELEAIEARTRAAATAPFNVNPNPGGTASDPYDIDLRSAPRNAETMRDIDERARRAVEVDRDLSDEHRGRVDELLRDRKTNRSGAVARHILATGRPEYRSAFAKLVTQPQPLLSPEEVRAVEEVRALNITTDNKGGYLMPFTLDPTIILTNNGAINPIRDLATVRTVATDNWQGVSTAGVAASYAAESAEVGDGTPTLAQPTVKIEKAHAFVPFTMEAEDDLANLSVEAAEMFADAKMRLEANKFTLGAGSGSNEPVGIVTAIAAYNSGSSLVAAATGDAYAVADVYALQEALPARYRPNGTWMMALPIINLTRKFGTAVSHAFLTDLAGGQPPLLLGQRLVENSEMDGSLTASATNYIAIYGDFKAYRIHDRIGLSIELVPHLFGENGRPTGERGWYARWRNGANLVDGNAMRMLNS